MFQFARLAFVVLFSYFMLKTLGLTEMDIGVVEFIIWGWAGTTFVEELRQVRDCL